MVLRNGCLHGCQDVVSETAATAPISLRASCELAELDETNPAIAKR